MRSKRNRRRRMQSHTQVPHGRSDKSVERYLRHTLKISVNDAFYWSTSFDENNLLDGEVLVLQDTVALLYEISKSKLDKTYKCNLNIIRDKIDYFVCNQQELCNCPHLAKLLMEHALSADPKARESIYIHI